MTTGNPIFRGCASSKRAGSCAKLDVNDWLKDIQNTQNQDEIIEIRFKNTRKDYYRNVNKLPLEVGDLVAVEGNPGHDIGMVSVTGDLVLRQMKRHKVTLINGELRKVYRKAKPVDIEKWEFAMTREHETMIKSRQLASDLRLNMKIGDVEYQGDGTKAIFYYIADERVDFRELIKVLAESFHIRVEMKQIGARQEAGRIGGIGPCGRELCCSSWMSNFSSVTTIAARHQEISMNPQKLAGQCSKLKCCINYEVDSYIDEQRDFPPKEKLETEEGFYIFLKSDIFKRIYYYTHDSKAPTGQIAVPVARVKKIMRMNQKNEKPERLIEIDSIEVAAEKAIPNYENVVGQDSLTRFDKPKEENRRKKRRIKRRPKTDDNKRDVQNNPANSDKEKTDNSNRRKIFKKKSGKKRIPGNRNNNNNSKPKES
ncbi:MAG: regulatory iron-sulfur-containing complex subunit RicT [Prolixibacteraceae bacterium]|jgi:cell fate regulator YaaT (PSP1 superfamily)|nr:regulatory iron-sulfur-containing complex subunit RicT [Prolixibacteraceae bacterium]